MVVVFDLELFHSFQAQNTVYVFIQIGAYVESIVHLEPFLVS